MVQYGRVKANSIENVENQHHVRLFVFFCKRGGSQKAEKRKKRQDRRTVSKNVNALGGTPVVTGATTLRVSTFFLPGAPVRDRFRLAGSGPRWGEYSDDTGEDSEVEV